MVNAIDIFSGFSVNDIDAARDFYRDALGLDVTEGPMGNLDIALPGGGHVFVYPKPDHTPASFTILNLAVDDIDAAVDELNAKGVVTKIYDDDDLHTDEKGIARGRAANRGPDIAWFRDPAGNVMSVLAG
ncbi:VOC family protein [Leifsonia shinshuensis]|uniref:Catechol 2,3-dioxygenase-like lactoylglutathione lyase family enzyme n=1 Tax=Leifsonia shinshuensis TaxID=150026 RepID=A0A853CRX4_9MICO|nr:VOC family protein [Leifsonia shinshuensis]NYJ23686.1 catechol 2,3-dioxygenase-like lactoylglutathione lyase family enzyme [Leifsonia shinshuensis]